MIIVSNNPSVWLAYTNVIEIDGTFLAVLEKARDLIHLGHKLLSHPLAGSVKPNQTPFKSLMISSKPGKMDFTSLDIIEKAMAMSRAMLKDNPLPQWPESCLEDLQLIDRDLLASALIS